MTETKGRQREVMKEKRHEKIIELINQYDIETQDELAEHLRNAGFQVTQATVSRDIRKLKLSKVPARDGKQEICASKRCTASDDRKNMWESYGKPLFPWIPHRIFW